MKLTDEQLDKYRAVRIHALIGQPDNGRKIMIRCPHGNIDKTPSCVIEPNNAFFCNSCRKYGFNALDFLLSLNGVEFKDAIEELDKYI